MNAATALLPNVKKSWAANGKKRSYVGVKINKNSSNRNRNVEDVAEEYHKQEITYKALPIVPVASLIQMGTGIPTGQC